jgi:hypothetical protein
MDPHDWSAELRMLQCRDVALAPGLSEQELRHAEDAHRFRFPPDLRSFLTCAVPISAPSMSFPDWRRPGSPELVDRFSWPFTGIAWDIEHNAFWWKAWGPRPAALPEAIAIAKDAVGRAPVLIPVAGHRYLPEQPGIAGNPVLSVHQTDIIHYGLDLRRYLACEFAGLDHAEAVSGEPRRIAFWSDFMEGEG